jgi:hypothetical protein
MAYVYQLALPPGAATMLVDWSRMRTISAIMGHWTPPFSVQITADICGILALRKLYPAATITSPGLLARDLRLVRPTEPVMSTVTIRIPKFFSFVAAATAVFELTSELSINRTATDCPPLRLPAANTFVVRAFSA